MFRKFSVGDKVYHLKLSLKGVVVDANPHKPAGSELTVEFRDYYGSTFRQTFTLDGRPIEYSGVELIFDGR